MVTKFSNWIHPEKGALLRMCHFNDVGSFWYNLCLLDSVLSNGVNILIREESHGYDVVNSFSNVGMDSLLMTFLLHSLFKCST